MVFALLAMSDDVLYDDDGVIDQDADRQRQRHQGEHVDGEMERADQDEGGNHRDRQGERGDRRGLPVVQEEHHDQHRQQRAHEQFVDDVIDGGANHDRVVTHDRQCGPLRQFGIQPQHRGVDTIGNLDGVSTGHLEDVDADGALPVDGCNRPSLLGAFLDTGNLAQAHRVAAPSAHDHLSELLRVGDPPGHPHQAFADATFQPASRNLEVLLAEGRHHLGHGDAEGLHPRRLDIDLHLTRRAARNPDLANASHRFQAARNGLIGEHREGHGREAARIQCQGENRLRRGIQRLDHRLFQVLRERGPDPVDLGTNVRGRNVDRATEVELDHHLRDALE